MSDVDEIKSRLNITDIIGSRITLKKAGRNFKALCPFHNEKTPSFVVSPDRQIFHCFGCGKGGTVFDFVMEYHHIDFAEALEDLAQLAGVKLERRPGDTPQQQLKHKLYEINHLAGEFYHYILTKHRLGEKARGYLKGRGITDKSVETFSLGYSPNSWEGVYAFLHKKGYDDGFMEQAGLIIKSQNPSLKTHSYYDRFRGRIMFTLKDHRSNAVGFAGRLLDPDAKEAKYINTSETPVYIKSNVLFGLDVTKAAIQKENEAIVMEGEFDVISSFQAGISNCVAIKGSALTEGHVHLLRRFTERLVFALDSDVAGDAASRRGIEIADAAGFDMKVVMMPSGKDPDEAVRENANILKKAVKDAIPIYDYFISSAVSRHDKESAFGKKKISEELLPVLAKIENPIVQGHYLRKLAQTLGISEQQTMDGMAKVKAVQARGRQPETGEDKKATGESRGEKLEIYVLGLMLQGKTTQWFEEFKEYMTVSDFAHQAVRQIGEKLEAYLVAHKVFLLKDFADSLPKELTPVLDEAYLWDISDFLEDEEQFAKEWERALRQLRRDMLRRKIYVLTREFNEKEKEKGTQTKNERDAMQKSLRELTGKLKALENQS